jgi:hypothetical protein
VGDASAAAALGPGEDAAPGNSCARQDASRGNAGAAASLGPGEDAATSPGEHRKHGETGSSRGNTDRSNHQGRREEGGESPRIATLGEKTGNDEKKAEHGMGDINGAKAHGEDAAADGVALGWYPGPGGEPTKTGDRSVGVAPGPANEQSHEGPTAPLDALPGGSDVVLVQADLAAAPAGGSSCRGRPRRLVRWKKKHTADPLILPPDEVCPSISFCLFPQSERACSLHV